MDAFEQLVSEIFFAEGYWVQTSVKVVLTKEEKPLIGRPSTPRPELDVVAYRAATNELLVIECKSFLDSTGVQWAELQDGHSSKKYKLFREPVLRETVLKRLALQMIEQGRSRSGVNVGLAMVAGKFKRGDEERLRQHFEESGWQLFGPGWLRERIADLATDSYSNQVSSIVAKLLLREQSGNGEGRTTIDRRASLKLLVSHNPKRPGSMSFKRFDGYFRPEATTVGGALSCGVRMDDIRNDLEKGYIALG